MKDEFGVYLHINKLKNSRTFKLSDDLLLETDVWLKIECETDKQIPLFEGHQRNSDSESDSNMFSDWLKDKLFIMND